MRLAPAPPSGTGFPPDDATHGAFAEITAQRPWLVEGGEVVAVVTHPWVMRAAVAAGCVLAWRGGSRRHAVVVGSAMAAGSALGVGLKLLVQRPRPPLADPIAAEIGYSMPSGHALNGSLAAGLLLVLSWPWLGGRGLRAWALAGGAVLVVVVCLDRLVLRAHYLSDVLVGIAVACAAVGTAHRLLGRERLGNASGDGDGRSRRG